MSPPNKTRETSAAGSTADRPPLRFEMLSQPRYLSAVRAMISNVAQRFGFSDHDSDQISLAVDEALCNVINHGYGCRDDGRIWVSVWPLEKNLGLRIVIEDGAPQVEPHTIQPRELSEIRPGGLGVHIIREVMDQVVYEKREEGGMRLTLIKVLRPSSHADGDARDTRTEGRGDA